jgi:hypothetical protein
MRTRELVQDQWQEDSGARAALTTTAITLALLGGWLLWQFGHGDTQTAATLAGRTTGNGPANIAAAPVRPASAGGAANGAPERGGMAETWATQHAGTSPLTIYVVESADAADRMRSLLSMADEIVVPSGTAPPSYRVIVVEAGRDAAQPFSEEQQIRNVEGLPVLKIVDLRLPGRVPPAGADVVFPID